MNTFTNKTPAPANPLGVGSTIWMFDSNRRVYDKNKGGNPIYREHWRPAKITGETSRSWITDRWGQKVLKRGPHPGAAFTQEEVDDDVFINDNRYTISDAVRRCRDAATLRAVALLVGYEPKP